MVSLIAQMAELVDALVSNTNEVTLVPVRLRLWVRYQKLLPQRRSFFALNSAGGEVYRLAYPITSNASFSTACISIWGSAQFG